jgi:diacylglycerol kinase (ATP)
MSTPLRVQVIFNPAAGQASPTRVALDQAIALWREAGWQVELGPTGWAGHATQLAQQAAAAGYDVVVAVGGDGTVNEVVNGLVGSQTALAVLPAGTVNIWAREMGLPIDLLQAARYTLEAQRRRIDVGLAQRLSAKQAKKFAAQRPEISPPGDRPSTDPASRYFLLMAGIGFDAAVTAGVKAQEKKWLGAIAYVKQALQLAWNYRGRRIGLYVDGKRITGPVLMVVVGNSQLYGGVVKFTAHATVDDGQLDVCVIKGRRMWSAPLRLITIFSRSYGRDPRVQYLQAQQVEVRGRRQLPVQLDGDYIGTTPMQFSIVPQSLWVLVPPQADPEIWQEKPPAQT